MVRLSQFIVFFYWPRGRMCGGEWAASPHAATEAGPSAAEQFVLASDDSSHVEGSRFGNSGRILSRAHSRRWGFPPRMAVVVPDAPHRDPTVGSKLVVPLAEYPRRGHIHYHILIWKD